MPKVRRTARITTQLEKSLSWIGQTSKEKREKAFTKLGIV
jgi:hypothetical protein